MKCRNIFCYNHSLKHKENCGVVVPVRGGQERILYAKECERRLRYNRVAKAPVLAWKWDKEHDKYYGRK